MPGVVTAMDVDSGTEVASTSTNDNTSSSITAAQKKLNSLPW